jgi:glycosyltransferase involved in cell wall biosynthesis
MENVGVQGSSMVSTRQPLVSVVTPVYNGERYLRECIDSVLAQSYWNWDLTIINNCSSDRSLEIAREYAAKDSRIRVKTNETFVRVNENYNIALRHISPQSKYCKPLAADDMLLPQCLESMVRLAEDNPRVAIVGAYGVYSRPEMGVYSRGVPYTQSVISGRELCRAYLLGKGPSVWGAPTFTLLRSDIVRSRHAFYNESNIHADSESCLEFLEQNDFGFVHQILTFTRIEDGSLTSFSQSFNTYLSHRLHVLMKYGPRHLNAEEVDEQIRLCLREYYEYLAWQVFQGRNREFWKFHREKLAALDHPLDAIQLSRSVLSYVLNLARNPTRIVAGAARWSRRLVSK